MMTVKTLHDSQTYVQDSGFIQESYILVNNVRNFKWVQNVNWNIYWQ